MKINTYGLKMKGLRKASGNTTTWAGHTQISYDMETGDILTNDHIGDSWSEYHDPSVVTICHTSRHMTMQQIADRIHDYMVERRAWA